MKKYIVSLGEDKLLEFFDTELEAVKFFQDKVIEEQNNFDDEYHHSFEEWWIAEIKYDARQIPYESAFVVHKL